MRAWLLVAIAIAVVALGSNAPWPALTTTAVASVGSAAPANVTPTLPYDSPAAAAPLSTTLPANPRMDASGTRSVSGTSPRVVRPGPGRVLATKARGGADEAFHYTRNEVVDLIQKNGLRPGSYLTKKGDLSPLQAQIDLALPPNRGLPSAVVRVDLAGLRKAGYDVGDFTRVGRRYNMPGGGTELQFGRAIPPQFLKVVGR